MQRLAMNVLASERRAKGQFVESKGLRQLALDLLPQQFDGQSKTPGQVPGGGRPKGVFAVRRRLRGNYSPTLRYVTGASTLYGSLLLGPPPHSLPPADYSER